MQKSNQVTQPVEIVDAELLQLVGGGLPKGTWNEPTDPSQPAKEQPADSGPVDLPKGTW